MAVFESLDYGMCAMVQVFRERFLFNWVWEDFHEVTAYFDLAMVPWERVAVYGFGMAEPCGLKGFGTGV